MSKPLVSVCIPSYNSQDFISECLASIFSQSLQDFEIIVSDNCSSDDTESAVKSFDDSRIRFYRQKENIGSRHNLNFTISQAQGTYIKTFCSDDVMLPSLLQDQTITLDARPHVKLITCDYIATDAKLNSLYSVKQAAGTQLGSLVTKRSVNELINYFGGPSSFMWRKEDTDAARYDPSLKYLSDFDFAAQIARSSFVANIDQPGFFYRRHVETETSSQCSATVQANEWTEMFLKWGANDYWTAQHLLQILPDSDLKQRLSSLVEQKTSPKARKKRRLLWAFWVRFAKKDWRFLSAHYPRFL